MIGMSKAPLKYEIKIRMHCFSRMIMPETVSGPIKLLKERMMKMKALFLNQAWISGWNTGC
jgi:hypothetical protein